MHAPSAPFEARESVIGLAGVQKQFETPDGPVIALTETNLTVRRGEFVVLLGPSGCGKTTMLRLMAGLIRPSAGIVSVGGRELWHADKRDDGAVADMGVVFPESSLFPWFSVEKNIALPQKLRGVGKAEPLDRARQLCKLVSISGFEQR